MSTIDGAGPREPRTAVAVVGATLVSAWRAATHDEEEHRHRGVAGWWPFTPSRDGWPTVVITTAFVAFLLTEGAAFAYYAIR